MKWKIRLSLFTAVAIMSVVIPCATAFAASPEITSAKVFSDYTDTGDWLIVIAYNCSQAPYFPNYPPEDYWTIQLLDDTGKVRYQNNMLQWGKRPGSIYIGPVGASTLTWSNPNYSVRIVANYNSSINASYTLNNTAWIEDLLPRLDSWCLTYAGEMYTYDLTQTNHPNPPTSEYISSTVQYGPMLSLGAGVIFDLGIPELSTVRPNIFEAKIVEFADWKDSTSNNTYANTLDDWQTSVGPELHTYFDDAGALVGMDGRYVGGLLVFIGFIAIAALAVTTGHLTAGATLASVALFGGVVIGLIPIAIVFVYIVLLTIMFVKNYWFGGT